MNFQLNVENANFKTQNKVLEDDVKQLEAFNKKHYTNLNTSNEEILNSKLSVMD